MKLKNTLIAVTDIDRSAAFYKDILGLEVENDFGANKTLTGGLCLQTADTFASFIGGRKISFRPNDSETYFEAEDFDGFVKGLEGRDIEYVTPLTEHSWGQRVVRFYDPDGHIVEVGEEMDSVVMRFVSGGMTPEETAARMDVPVSYVNGCIGRKSGK